MDYRAGGCGDYRAKPRRKNDGMADQELTRDIDPVFHARQHGLNGFALSRESDGGDRRRRFARKWNQACSKESNSRFRFFRPPVEPEPPRTVPTSRRDRLSLDGWRVAIAMAVVTV